MAQAWERIAPKDGKKGESDPAWGAFQVFRDLPWREENPGPRTVKQVSDELKKHVQLIHRWSNTWNWKERVTEFDRFMDAQTVEETIWRIKDMKKRQATYARAIQRKAMTKLMNTPADDLPPSVALSMLKEGSTLERLALGEATENIQHVGQEPIKTVKVYLKAQDEEAE